MEIEIGNNTFPIQIIRKNNKNIYFRFKDNTLSITCNRFIAFNRQIIIWNIADDIIACVFTKR